MSRSAEIGSTPRVLTVRQPWAWAIIHGGKDVENRSWKPPEWLGALFIHAGSAFEEDGYEKVRLLSAVPTPSRKAFVHGAILGVVDVRGALRESSSPWAITGHWHWQLSNPRPIDPPWPVTGKLGLWHPPAEIMIP